MNTKEIKCYLLQVKQADEAIERKEKELERLREMATDASTKPTAVPVARTINGDRVGDTVAKIVDAESQIADMIIDFLDLKHEAIGAIHLLTDPRELELLYMHYILYKPLREIAETMRRSDGEKYSYEHIRWLHGKSLSDLAERISPRMHDSF